MSDRKRYMAGIVMTLIFHMAIFLVLGFLGGRYVKIVPGAEILQITLNAGGGTSTNRSADILKAWSTNNTSSDIPPSQL